MRGSGRPVRVVLLALVMSVRVMSVGAAPAGAAGPGAAGGAETAEAAGRVAAVDAARLDDVGVATALEAIDSCIGRLNPDIDIGYDRVVARCPTLVGRLDGNGVATWLPRDWRRPGNDLSAGGLRALRELILHELQMAPATGARYPRVQQVPEILASLTHADDEHSGWWARTREWLRAVFANGDEAGDDSWLGRMIGQSGVPQAVLELASYGALALVVVLAVGIVGNELWTGGVWGRFRRGRRRGVGEGGGVAGDSDGGRGGARLDWAGVLGAPVSLRLGLLLELVVARLNESGGVRLSRGLTGRELLVSAGLSDERARERLGVVVRASERVRYSGAAIAEEEVAVVMEEGRRLLEGIGVAGAGGGAPPGAGLAGNADVPRRGVGV